MQFEDIDDYIEHCKTDPLPVLPIPIVAEYIGITPSGVTGRLKRGTLEQVKIGKSKFVSVRSLLKLNEDFDQKVSVVRAELEKLARQGVDSVFYGPIMSVLGLSSQVPADRNEIGWILGAVSEKSCEENGTLLTVLVHRKAPGATMPGPGFFSLAGDLGFEWDDDREFVEEQTRRVLKVYAK